MKEKSRTFHNTLNHYIPPPKRWGIYGLLVKTK